MKLAPLLLALLTLPGCDPGPFGRIERVRPLSDDGVIAVGFPLGAPQMVKVRYGSDGPRALPRIALDPAARFVDVRESAPGRYQVLYRSPDRVVTYDADGRILSDQPGAGAFVAQEGGIPKQEDGQLVVPLSDGGQVEARGGAAGPGPALALRKRKDGSPLFNLSVPELRDITAAESTDEGGLVLGGFAIDARTRLEISRVVVLGREGGVLWWVDL